MQRDPAFQWESQALREAIRRRGRGPGEVAERAPDSTQVTSAAPTPAAPVPAGRPPSPPPGAAAHPPDHVPDGTMLIPIAAWDKMLMQLGNLHEAGQQLAEARERAGKAETEALFLRERLGDLRAQLADATGKPGASEPESDAAGSSNVDEQPDRLWRYVFNRWQHRRSR